MNLAKMVINGYKGHPEPFVSVEQLKRDFIPTRWKNFLQPGEILHQPGEYPKQNFNPVNPAAWPSQPGGNFGPTGSLKQGV